MGQIILERARDEVGGWTLSQTPADWSRVRRVLSGWRRWLVWAIAPLAVAVPIVMAGSLLWGIWHWSGAVPLDDEWLWALLLDRAKGGGLPLGDIWAPHNGHRILFPRSSIWRWST
jgi:hypothetical protein